jgi:general secretion pathway protein H
MTAQRAYDLMTISTAVISSCGRLRRLIMPAGRHRGFTLLELLLVIAIIAIGSAGVSFAFRDSAQNVLDREADKLAVLLEAGRLQSRSTGVALAWVAHSSTALGSGASGYSIVSAQEVRRLAQPQTTWAAPELKAEGAAVILGPEPMLPAQSITLSLGERKLKITSDGLRPFKVEAL